MVRRFYRRQPLWLLLPACLWLGTFSPATEPAVIFSDQEITQLLLFTRTPPPSDPGNRWSDNETAARLGRRLFFSTRFSANGAVGCVTCHQPELGFGDGRERAMGLSEGPRHTPSLWDSAFGRWFFWDGRSDSLWSQALKPFENETEMGLNRNRVVHYLARDNALRAAYESVFGPLPTELSQTNRFPEDAMPVSGRRNHPWSLAWNAMEKRDQDTINHIFVNLGKALAAYERKLVSPQNPFDAFLLSLKAKGNRDTTKLSAAAQRGAKLFIGKARCILCHSGPQFSDNSFHQTGVPHRDGSFPKDAGRYAGVAQLLKDPFNQAGRFSDNAQSERAQALSYLKRDSSWWGQFKTPRLRQVAQHPPYMHAGQLADLAAVVRFYNTLEGRLNNGHHVDPLLIPLALSRQEEQDLVAFLESLSAPADPDNIWLKPPE